MSEFEAKGEMSPDDAAEFSRVVDVTTTGAQGRHFNYQATAEECQALADRFSILSVDDLRAECGVRPVKKGEYHLEGRFSATVTQACGVSLEPVAEQLSCSFAVTLLNAPRRKPEEGVEIDFDVDEEDIEILRSNQVDVGEIIAQHLSLEINPYPRKADATGEELGARIIREEEAELRLTKKNPFDVLKSLKHKT